MKDVFHRNVSTYSLRSLNDLLVARVNQTTFGLHSIRYEGSVTWNHLLEHIKTAENIGTFNRLIRNWKRPQWKCACCKNANENTSFLGQIITTFVFYFYSYVWWLMVLFRLEVVWPGGLWLRGRYMTKESAVVVYCPWSWGLGKSALGWSVPFPS